MHASYFEYYFITAIKGRYNVISSIDDTYRMHTTVNYDEISGGGRPLSPESTVDSSVSLGITLNLIDSCL